MEFISKDIQKAFQELIKHDYPEITQRIIKSIREKRQNKRLFGYDLVEGVLTINQEESKIVKWIYERYFAYSENPPIELVEITMKQPKYGKKLQKDMPYEEAKLLVTDPIVKEYIAHELSLKEFYFHALSEKGTIVNLEDILALPMSEMPIEELEKLMSDILQLERMRKEQQYSCLVKRVLTKDYYSGEAKFKKCHTALKGARPFEDQFIVVRDHHEAIISPELFRAVQEQRGYQYEEPDDELER